MFVKAVQVAKFVKVQLWGEKKQGKTRFALSFPGPIAVIDSEKGSLPYADQYDFDYKEVIRWPKLGEALGYIQKHPGAYKTLVIDSITPLYEDFIAAVALSERNRWGKDIISQQAWGSIKRNWKGCLSILLELPMHIILTTRAKDEYENVTNKDGEQISQKTGSLVADTERSTGYLLDFILECRAVEPKVAKGKPPEPARYEVVVKGSRRHELQLGQVIDVTKKKAFDVVFGSWVGKLTEGKAMEQSATVSEMDPGFQPAAAVAAAVAAVDPKEEARLAGERGAPPELAVGAVNKITEPKADPGMTSAEKKAEIDLFTAGLQGVKRLPGPKCTADDLKVLFTRAGGVTWPDGHKLKGEEAKAWMRGLFGLESTTELTKPEVDFLYAELGDVLAKKAFLALGEGGIVKIAPAAPQPVGVPYSATDPDDIPF